MKEELLSRWRATYALAGKRICTILRWKGLQIPPHPQASSLSPTPPHLPSRQTDRSIRAGLAFMAAQVEEVSQWHFYPPRHGVVQNQLQLLGLHQYRANLHTHSLTICMVRHFWVWRHCQQKKFSFGIPEGWLTTKIQWFSPRFPSQQTPTRMLKCSPLSLSAHIKSVCTQTPAQRHQLLIHPHAICIVLLKHWDYSHVCPFFFFFFLYTRKLNYTHTELLSPHIHTHCNLHSG